MSSLTPCKITINLFRSQLFNVRRLSTKHISDNLRYRPTSVATIYEECQRPLVLLYAWLGAKSKHIDKFEQFYSEKGFDVLKIKIKPFQLLWPKCSQTVIDSVFEFVNEDRRRTQPLLVHAFSVGAYLYGEGLHKIKYGNNKLYANVADRIRGQVFDSPVDSNNIPFGFSRAVFNHPFAQTSSEMLIAAYLRALDRPVTSHYRRSSKAFYETPVPAPALLLYSRRDVVALVENVERVAATWRRSDIAVAHRLFDSPHVLHYQQNSADYLDALETFLMSVGLNERYKGAEQFLEVRQ